MLRKAIKRHWWKALLVAITVYLCFMAAKSQPEYKKVSTIPAEPVIMLAEEPQIQETPRLWGLCRVTAYCSCSKCCGEYAKNRPVDSDGLEIVKGASGERLQPLVSCASSLPFGTELYIPDLDMHLVVQDRAAKWIDKRYDGYYVDIYIDDCSNIWNILPDDKDFMEVLITSEQSNQ